MKRLIDLMARECPEYAPIVFIAHGSTFLHFVRRRVYILFISERAGGVTAVKLIKKCVSEIWAQRLDNDPTDVRQIMLPEDDPRVLSFIARAAERSHTAFLVFLFASVA